MKYRTQIFYDRDGKYKQCIGHYCTKKARRGSPQKENWGPQNTQVFKRRKLSRRKKAA